MYSDTVREGSLGCQQYQQSATTATTTDGVAIHTFTIFTSI